MSTPPVFHLIGGPNGAGKTTFAKEYLPNEANCLRFHNSDEIATGISPFDPAAAQTQAARILLKNLKGSIAHKETFALESTLSGKTYLRYLAEAKTLGFVIHLHFLHLSSADESWARVESRVAEGGHAVPKDAVYRRFPRCWENFQTHYLPLADRWFLWNASSLPFSLIAETGGNDTLPKIL
ncbi:MAG: AAA family ATPase [Akkermansiaceae bacterium]